MADGNLGALVAQPLDVGAVGRVRALHGVAEIDQHLGDAAHADAADADEVDRTDVARQFHRGSLPIVLTTRSASRSAASMAPWERAACGHCYELLRRAGKRADLGRQPVGGEVVLAQAQRAPCPFQHAGIGGLVLVERVRQRHQDGGPPDRRELRHGRGAGARDDEMGGRDPRRQIGEERRNLGRDLRPRINVLDAREVLLPRLLHDDKPHLQMRLESFDRRRHDVRHDARALAAAERQQAQLTRRIRGGVRHRRRRDDRRPHRIAGARGLGGKVGSRSSTPAKLVAMASTRDARNLLARPMTAFCSWISVGTLRSVAASTGGTVG